MGDICFELNKVKASSVQVSWIFGWPGEPSLGMVFRMGMSRTL